jgi:gliding motility-associated-like protein
MFGSGPACVNSPVTFTDQSSNTNGAIVSWNWTSGINTSTLQNPSFTFANTGMQTVTLIVATAAGCSDTLTRTVYVNPSPQAAFTSVITCPTDLALSDSSLISSGTIVSWNWNLGDSTTSALQNTTHTYADTGVFVVTLTVLSDSGCVSTQSDTLIFIPCVNGEVNPPVVPSAFTPNGDGHNDVLYVKGGPFKQLDFRIYNEWGNMIFHSESQSIGWDGNYKSKVQPEGPYVWTIVGTTADGVEVKASNVVTIIR